LQLTEKVRRPLAKRYPGKHFSVTVAYSELKNAAASFIRGGGTQPATEIISIIDYIFNML
jgi:hypothetical protein